MTRHIPSYQHLNSDLATLALWYVVNTSLSAFYRLVGHFSDAKTALIQGQLWQDMNIHHAHLKRLNDSDDVIAFLSKVTDDISRGHYKMLLRHDDDYPHQLTQLYDPPPVLFYRGNRKRLSDTQIAIVGTRHPTKDAEKITFDIAQYLAHQGFVITSGLAHGVDKMAHLGALSCHHQGMTVGVLGTGIDVCYPKNHHALYAQIIHDGGVLVSELLPATPATKHHFPRRNRLVAGLSQATIVTEATLHSGSLISAKLTAEQGKQVFAVPSTINNPNAEGCHHLIREGATLIYHPDQVIEDLRLTIDSLPTPSNRNPSTNTFETHGLIAPSSIKDNDIPDHLHQTYAILTDTPQDLDALIGHTNLDTGDLLAMLMELEILGKIHTIGGRYVKTHHPK